MSCPTPICHPYHARLLAAIVLLLLGVLSICGWPDRARGALTLEPTVSRSQNGSGPQPNDSAHLSDSGYTLDYYNIGLPKSVKAVGPAADADHREFTHQRGDRRSEQHKGGPWHGWRLEWEQDQRGRVGAVVIYDGAQEQFRTSFSYDPRGLLSAVQADGDTYDYTLEAGTGRILEVDRAGVLQEALTWRPDGLLASHQTTGGLGWNYSYNYNSRLQRTQRTASRGVAWNNMTYDGRGQLTSVNLSTGMSLGYDYDPAGNRTALTGWYLAAPETWAYNALNETLNASRPREYGIMGSVAADAEVELWHGVAGVHELVPTVPLGQDAFFFRRWTFGGANPDSEWIPILVRGTLEGEGHMGTDAIADVLLEVEVPPGLEDLEHDSDGNLTRDSRWTYQWNLAGRLAQMTRREQALAPGIEGQILEFTYDVDGRRTLTKVTTIVEGEEPVGQRTTVEERRMLWDGWLPVAEEISIDETPTLRRYFVWGLDLDHTRGGAGGIGGLLAIVEEDGRTLLPVHDGHGNITAVVNAANGHTVARYDYGPFGELIGQSGDVGASPFRYQSKYLDPESGLHYFGHRYYAGHRGRWISRDPLGEVGGWNLYAYCEKRRGIGGVLDGPAGPPEGRGLQAGRPSQNDPAGRIDLNGLSSWRLVAGSVQVGVTPEGRIIGTVRIRNTVPACGGASLYPGSLAEEVRYEERTIEVTKGMQLEARLFGGGYLGMTLDELQGQAEQIVLERAEHLLENDRLDQFSQSVEIMEAVASIAPGWESGEAISEGRYGAALGYAVRDLVTFWVGGTAVRGATRGRQVMATSGIGATSGLAYTGGTIATERLEAAFTGQDYHGTWGGDAMHIGLGMAFGGAGGYVAGRLFRGWGGAGTAMGSRGDGGLFGRGAIGTVDDLAAGLSGVTSQSTRIARGIRSGEIGVEILGRWQYFKTAWRAGGAEFAFGTRAFAQNGTIVLKASRFRGGRIFGDAVHEGTHVLDMLSKRGLAGRTRFGLEARAWSAEMQFLRATGRPTYADSYLGLRNLIRSRYTDGRF